MASKTFSASNLPGMKVDCEEEITTERIFWSLFANNLGMTLYNVLRQEIGWKFEAFDAFETLEIGTRVVAFHCFKSSPDMKNSAIASVTYGPTILQKPVKNSAGYPSGPRIYFWVKRRNQL